MRRLIFCLYGCILLDFCIPNLESKAFAGFENYPSGARATGMGNATITLNSVWANFYNQANLAELKSTTIGIHHEISFGISQLSISALAIDIPAGTGTLGLCMSDFGYSAYRENKTGLAYSLKLFKGLSAGIQLEYLSAHSSDDSPKSRTFTFEVGILSEINKYIRLGIHVFNPANIQFAGGSGELLLPRATVGLGYKPLENLVLTVETEKCLDRIETYRAGIEYSLTKYFQLRTGVSSSPFENSFGTGFEFKGIAIDIAMRRNPILGYSPSFSMSYKF